MVHRFLLKPEKEAAAHEAPPRLMPPRTVYPYLAVALRWVMANCSSGESTSMWRPAIAK
jgi:hypothetical protein